MNYLKQVQTGIDYIEANLDMDIALSQVAKESGLSQWHFQRIFKALTNETLKTYIRSRRLANSLDKLLTSELRIIDIAVSAGFESQESFTRAFKTAFSLTPSEYRKLGDKSLFLRKLEFDETYLRHINKNLSLEPEFYTQKPMQLIGMRTCFYSVDSEKNNLGEKLPLLWEHFLARVHEIKHVVPGDNYGIVRQLSEDTDQLEYYAAVAVNKLAAIPEGMLSFELPQSDYAKFTHKGEVKLIDSTVNYIYSSWLLNSGKRHTSGADIEVYGADYDPVSSDSIIHYAIPIV